MTSQLSPNSPTEDSSSESRPDKPRLQRSMGQSKRTFRLKKSRRAHIEVKGNNITDNYPSLICLLFAKHYLHYK